jgi:hypothetical protein
MSIADWMKSSPGLFEEARGALTKYFAAKKKESGEPLYTDDKISEMVEKRLRLHFGREYYEPNSARANAFKMSNTT